MRTTSLHWLLLSLVAGATACAPPQPSRERFDESVALPIDPSALGVSARAESVAQPTPARPEPPPRRPACGMPEGLYRPGWPHTLEPTSPREPSPFVPGSATLAVLPDTQYYARCRNGHLARQRSWIEHERDERNVLAILTLGDLTDSNTDAEWQHVRSALTPLDPSLPVLLTIGNHDYGEGGTANRRFSLLDRYFDRSFGARSGALLETAEPNTLANAFYALSFDGIQLGVLSLEWSPRKKIVAWANDVLARHPSHRVVVTTHAYLYSDGSRYDFAGKRDSQDWNPLVYRTAEAEPKEGAYDGEMLWNELIRKHQGIFLVLSGHVLNDGEGALTSVGDHGNLVHQMLSNYQMLDEGGLGYLRLLELRPDGRTLRVKTYSPSLDLFATDPAQDFRLEINPPLGALSH
ncbi:MAG TPA: metallophosphoesterase [Polyangiaceae bacterium]|nr:metallophosphoesterase [Polyangiaceae bacterium]